MTEHVHPLDGAALRDQPAALDGIAAALSFPDYFGRNLDALYDCLTDLSWLPPGAHVLRWSRPDVLRAADPAGYAEVWRTLSDAVTATAGTARRLRVELGQD